MREIAGSANTSQPQRHSEQALGSKPLKNPRHEKLAREFAAGASKADAWRAVFGREPTSGNPSRTFRRQEIQDRVEFLRAEFCRQAGISLASLQARLLRIADANAADILQNNSGKLTLRDLGSLSPAAKAAISEIEIGDDGTIKLKTTKAADRLHAIDSLLKTIGGFESEDANSGSQGGSVIYNIVTGVPEGDYERDAANRHRYEAPANRHPYDPHNVVTGLPERAGHFRVRVVTRAAVLTEILNRVLRLRPSHDADAGGPRANTPNRLAVLHGARLQPKHLHRKQSPSSRGGGFSIAAWRRSSIVRG
jgi:hypothetical protein